MNNRKEIDIVKFIQERIDVDANQETSLYKLCFIAMEVINNSILNDTRKLIAKSNEFYSTEEDSVKNEILFEIAKILNKYNETPNNHISNINDFLLKITRRDPRKNSTRLLKQP